jgi:hypothetical protein
MKIYELWMRLKKRELHRKKEVRNPLIQSQATLLVRHKFHRSAKKFSIFKEPEIRDF